MASLNELRKPTPAAPPRALRVLLFLLLWVSFGYFYQSGEHNEAARLDLTRALVEDGTLWVDFYIYNSADLIRHVRDGTLHFYSGKAPGSSLLMAPAFKLCSVLLSFLQLPEWLHWHMVVYGTEILTLALLSAAAASAIFGVVWRVTESALSSLLAITAVWLGTILFPFSTLLFGHGFAAATLSFAFAILFALRWQGHEGLARPGWSVAAAGFLAGFGVVIDYPVALLSALLGLYFLDTLRRMAAPDRLRLRLLGAFAAGGAVSAAILLLYNVAAFGTPLYVPYQAYVGGETFAAHSQGVLGIHWPGLGKFLDVLAEITIRPQRGLLYLGVEDGVPYATNPVLWLALAGLAVLFLQRRTRAEALLVGAACLVYFTFNACYGDSIVYWGGGASVGPRHLVPLLPLLALPLGAIAQRLWWAFHPLLAISVFSMLLATGTEPRVGYEFANPAKQLFAASYLEGRLSTNRGSLFDLERHLVTEDSTAFNLGKAAGLPGAWQLAPLLAWWVLVGGWLIRAAAAQDARRAPLSSARAPAWLASLPGAPGGWRAGIVLLVAFAVGVLAAPLLRNAGAAAVPGSESGAAPGAD